MKKLYIFFMALLALNACTDPDEPYVANISEGGLLEVQTPLVNFVVGEGATYQLEVLSYQGAVKTTSIEVYSSFSTYERDLNGNVVYRNADGNIASPADKDSTLTALTSNEVLFTTVTPEATTGFVSFGADYASLIDGLTIANQAFNGGKLPASDGELMIGDSWSFRFVSKTSDGKAYENFAGAKISVSTRYAGTYEVIESSYYHPTAGPQGNWNGEKVVIESVDAITYHILANGPFGLSDNPDNEFYFTIDASLVVDIPKEYKGKTQTVWGADEVANCDENPSLFVDGQCDDTGYVIKDDVKGQDILKMSHGYIRSSGTRQFRYVLRKIVD